MNVVENRAEDSAEMAVERFRKRAPELEVVQSRKGALLIREKGGKGQPIARINKGHRDSREYAAILVAAFNITLAVE